MSIREAGEFSVLAEAHSAFFYGREMEGCHWMRNQFSIFVLSCPDACSTSACTDFRSGGDTDASADTSNAIDSNLDSVGLYTDALKNLMLWSYSHTGLICEVNPAISDGLWVPTYNCYVHHSAGTNEDWRMPTPEQLPTTTAGYEMEGCFESADIFRVSSGGKFGTCTEREPSISTLETNSIAASEKRESPEAYKLVCCVCGTLQ